jgi:hypothetical protein
MPRDSGYSPVTALNYVIKAFEDLLPLPGNLHGTLAATILNAREKDSFAKTLYDLYDLAHDAQKFVMPPRGLILSKDEIESMVDARVVPAILPYPVVVAEYTHPYADNEDITGSGQTESTKRVAIAATRDAIIAKCPRVLGPLIEEGYKENAHDCFFVFSLSYIDKLQHWMMIPSFGVVNKTNGFKGFFTGVMPCASRSYLDNFGRDRAEEVASSDIWGEIKAIVHLLLALSVRNVKKLSIDAPTKLNAKRTKQGKRALYEYHVLDIVVEMMRTGISRGPVDDRASPRMHARRGHVRHLETGKVTWVRHTIVGKPSAGRVEKDYRVKHY